ncbi:MAG: hypothetical protein ACXV5D_00210 [Halobacteriota archaeon]
MTLMWRYYRDSAADSLNACYYHLAEMKKANDYATAYAHTKALIFEAKSSLDSIAATLNSLFELDIVESHVFFNKEFVDKFSTQTRFPSVKEKYPQIAPQPLYDVLVASDRYFPRLRTYLGTFLAFLQTSDGTYLLSDMPGVYSFKPGIEAFQYCEQLLESVKYVFHFFNELVEDVPKTEAHEV